mgnify:CR=1 FL=1
MYEHLYLTKDLNKIREKILNHLATHASLHVYPAAMPAPFIAPSTCLAARPLVLYLGAQRLGFPARRAAAEHVPGGLSSSLLPFAPPSDRLFVVSSQSLAELLLGRWWACGLGVVRVEEPC